jgi:hypothetical protein
MEEKNVRDFMFWLAGFYELKHRPGGKLVASITQKEAEPLLEIKKFLGIGNVCGGKRDCHTYQVSDKMACEFLCKISPYLMTKRKKDQLHKAMDKYVERKLGKRVESPIKSAVALNRQRDDKGHFIKD